jgi:hypothetical protein
VKTAPFTWTVNAVPTISAPTPQATTVTPLAPVSLSMGAQVSSGTGPFTYSAAGLPSWLTINGSTGAITGTAPASNTDVPITVKVTDASGVSATTPTFTWHVSDLRLAIPDYNIGTGTSVSTSLPSYTSGGRSTYSYAVTAGKPLWLTVSSAGAVSGKATAGSWTVKTTVTDSAGASVTANWNITVT